MVKSKSNKKAEKTAKTNKSIKSTKTKDDLFGYIKLGRLRKPIADKIGRKPADIFIDYNGLRHIEKGRVFALKELEMDALLFVKKIVDNFTIIKVGKNGTLLLVALLKENQLNNIAVVELQMVSKNSIYLVKTAMPRRKFATDEITIWSKKIIKTPEQVSHLYLDN